MANWQPLATAMKTDVIGKKEIVRPIANFSPSLWGDRFINYVFDNQVANELSKKIEVLKTEVKSMLTSDGIKMVETMNLIDTIEHLGISYHFEKEIEQKLEQLFSLNIEYEDDESYDLYTVGVHFRLFRQHGYRIPSDVFSKFTNGSGKFLECPHNDAKGLLSLYEAAHLRIHGEDILEEALAFATATLKSMVPNLTSPLKELVSHSLVQPWHWGNPRLEARYYISFYEDVEYKNKTLLKLAKMDYNLLQMLHKEELREVSSWWKELDLITKVPYARDRVVECFFWAMITYHEPQYSRARIMLTKTIQIISVIDDTYDAYGTLDELEIFTKAIERWNICEIDHIPEYMMPLYKATIELHEKFDEELAKEGRSYAAYYTIEELKEMVKAYYVEAKWFIKGPYPPFSELLENALITSGYSYLTASSLLGTRFTIKEDFECLRKKPKVLIASLKVCRLIADVAAYEIETERGQSSGIDCYMKEFSVTQKAAEDKFLEMAIDAWKDINEENLKPSSCSRLVLDRILNLDRAIEVTYKAKHDGYTQPEKVLEPHIIALFIDPIEI